MFALGREAVNSDEAVVGLMARQILHGHLSAFYWGQSYGGGEPYVVAVVFRALGTTPFALGFTPVLLDLLAALLLYLIGRRLFSRKVAALAALVFWLWPEVTVWQSTLEYGFRFATLDLGLAATLMMLRIVAPAVEGDPDAAFKRRLEWTMLGLFLGLGWWCSPEIAYFALPIGLILLYRVVRRRLAVRAIDLGLALCTLVVGALPWLWSNFGSDFASLRSGVQPNKSFVEHLHVLGVHALPIALDLQLTGAGHWLFGLGPSIAIEIALVVAGLLLVVHLALERRAAFVVLFFVLFPVLYSLSPFTWFWLDGRYILYLVPIASLLLAAGVFELAELPLLRRALGGASGRVLAVLLVVLAFGASLDAAHDLAPFRPDGFAGGPRADWTSYDANPNYFDVQLADDLVHLGVHDLYAGYWIAYPLDLASGGRVTASDFRYARSKPLLAEVRASTRPAWLFADPADDTPFHRDVALAGASLLDPGCAVSSEKCVTAAVYEAVLDQLHVGYRSWTLTDDGFILVRPDRDVPLAEVVARLPAKSR